MEKIRSTLARPHWVLLGLASVLLVGACADDDDGSAPDGGTGSGGRAQSTGGRNSSGLPATSGGTNSGGQLTGGAAPSSGGAGGSVVQDPDASFGGKAGGGKDASSGNDGAYGKDAGGEDASNGDGGDAGVLLPLTVTVGQCAYYPSPIAYAVLSIYADDVERFEICESNTTCVYRLAPGTIVQVDCYSPGQTFEERYQVAPPTAAECHRWCDGTCSGAPYVRCNTTLQVPTAISVDWERNECWPEICP